MEYKKFLDFDGAPLNLGDRVIIGKGKDVGFGCIVNIPENIKNEEWAWINVKTENSNTTVYRRTNQVIKVNYN